MHRYFMRMKADNFDFFFAMDLNEKGRLRNVFWADARSRAACKEFGDVVTFDTTYLVNKHNMPFAPFVGVNHHAFEIERKIPSSVYGGGGGGQDLLERSKSIPVIVVRSSSAYVVVVVGVVEAFFFVGFVGGGLGCFGAS
ncbi:hypothetical protein RHMOL_Rhmol12G0121100 [Rhododendron molle]|uniref:Uncharacterized protein n=1 Tax=Rhododendron molle TaxID=49168 RepID=A0ACC0LHK1_RHOML|nr:hypothetical protein RHMOL_Rhmol12G0121100 [Rhododendron molle]